MTKYLILLVALQLSSCKRCIDRYDISQDDGKCWRDCTLAAATSMNYEWNFDFCLKTACGAYPHTTVCK